MITTRYHYRRPLLDLARRVLAAWVLLQIRRAAEDRRPLRSSTDAIFWPAVIASGLLLGLYVVATRHTYLSWNGFHDINGGIR